MIKAIIFDLDGTLFDTEKVFYEAWHQVGEKHQISVNEEFLIQLTGSSREEEQIVYQQNPQYSSIVEEAIQKGRQNINNIIDQKIDISRPGAKELLLYLENHHYAIAVASNSALNHVKGMVHTLDKKYTDVFDEIVSAHEVANGKPAPDVFLETAKRLNVKADECLVVEDTINGLKAAKAAGMQTILIKSVLPLTEDKKNHADHIVNDHHEIICLFKSEKI